MTFAGLWEEWQDGATGEIVTSCTVITTEANELMRPLHDRMPVILDPKDYVEWLDATPGPKEAILALLQPFPSERMRVCPVSSTVNNVRNEGPGCIEQVG
jgi:putative SOS response-associated peptidase YedK